MNIDQDRRECDPDRDSSRDSSRMRHSGILDAFKYAIHGFAYAFKTQRNIRIHTAIASIALIAGIVLRIDRTGWLAVAICIFAVFATELVNTSIELIVDRLSPNWSEAAMHIKDCAAGAVLLAAVGSIIVGALVFIPPICRFLGII